MLVSAYMWLVAFVPEALAMTRDGGLKRARA
jgi:hypothetical protein